jgi:hypothetical protein
MHDFFNSMPYTLFLMAYTFCFGFVVGRDREKKQEIPYVKDIDAQQKAQRELEFALRCPGLITESFRRAFQDLRQYSRDFCISIYIYVRFRLGDNYGKN